MSESCAGLPLHQQSFATLAARAQRLRDERAALREARPLLRRRIALLGGFTTQFVTRLLDLFLFELGVDAEFFESSYASFTENILNPSSELYAFRPEITLLLLHSGNLENTPQLLAAAPEAQQLARQEAARLIAYAQLVAERIPSRVVLSNLEEPALRTLGNYEGAAGCGALAFVREVNAQLFEQRPASVSLFDLAYLAARFGLDRALDAKSYCLTKQPFSFDFLVPYCHALASTVALGCGLAKKCAVLDLDGTLWGGTLAEDGAERLTLGPDSAEGEAFQHFQRYLKRLAERGVLLAVCSKNDDANARQVFESHPHMLLRLSDVASFVANWENKAENLVRVANSLNIGLDSLVFIDNSPEERHLVRQALPEVSVVELPEDPADYARALDEGCYFEIAELTHEATIRTRSLRQNEQREQSLGHFVDYAAYLRSLELQAEIRPIAGASFERCAELIQRSNQFNLRSVRHSQADLRAFVAVERNAAFCVSLADRFGSYGIISVVLLEGRADVLFIDTWLMSCRVLKKGVEQLVFEEILSRARQLGALQLLAEYRPTPKNALVAGLLAGFGFEPGPSTPLASTWSLDLRRPPAVPGHSITIRRSMDDER
jgi:FkbH-like protein